MVLYGVMVEYQGFIAANESGEMRNYVLNGKKEIEEEHDLHSSRRG
jgi:hypothetical protein